MTKHLESASTQRCGRQIVRSRSNRMAGSVVVGLAFLWMACFLCGGGGWVVAFSTGAGSCDGVGGFHWEEFSSNTNDTAIGEIANRTVQAMSLRQHGMEFTVNGVELIEQDENVVTVVALTPDNDFTAQLNISSVTLTPFKGTLIRVQAPFAIAPNWSNDTATAEDVSFLLQPLSDNAQISSFCYGSVQGVTHFDNSNKVHLAALFSDVSADDSVWTIDVTVVEANNATTSIYSYSQYQILVQSSSSNATDVSIGTTENTNSTAAPWSMIGSNATSSPSAAPPQPSEIPQTLPPGVVFTLTPTASTQPSFTVLPTTTDRCFLCGTVDQTITSFDAIVVFYDTAITCQALAQGAAQYTAAPCGVAMGVAQEGCGCSPTTNVTTIPTVRPVVVNETEPTVNPTKSPLSGDGTVYEDLNTEFGTNHSSDSSNGTSCVVCPVTNPNGQVVLGMANGTKTNYTIPCRTVNNNSSSILLLLDAMASSCAKVQQEVARSCGCLVLNDEQPPSIRTSDSSAALWHCSTGAIGAMTFSVVTGLLYLS